MKGWEIARFEFGYQARRLVTWLYFAALALVAFAFVRGNYVADATYADFYVNAPFIIAAATVLCTLFWLVVGAGTTGEIAARDAETGMQPLTFTAPVSRVDYLGGRFLAALSLNALLLLGAVPLGVLLAVHLPGVDPAVVGPFRPEAYLTAWGWVALPNVFIGTAIQFAWATLSRRAIGSYLGGVLLLVVAYAGIFAVMLFLQRQDYAALLDVFGHLTIFDITMGWTAAEKSTRLIAMDGYLLRSRLVWIGVALGVLAFTYARFGFTHGASAVRLPRVFRRRRKLTPTTDRDAAARPVSFPQVQGTFGAATHLRQTLALARTSFLAVAKGRGGLVLLLVIAFLTVMLVPENMTNMGTPLLPATGYVLSFLTTPLSNPFTPWVAIPLLIILWAGELVWRERQAGLGELFDAAPVPQWVVFTGKFLGLALMLVVWMVLLMLAGLVIQLRAGYTEHQVWLFVAVLFGLQLPIYLLFAALVLAVQGVVPQKYLGHLTALLTFVLILFGPMLGIEHKLLLFGDAPGWSYSDMRGLGGSLWPWLWFMGYWAAWALLLAVGSSLLWVRGEQESLGQRLQLARRRLTPPTAWAAAASAGLVLALGGFIFYNTNVRADYMSSGERLARAAAYERQYARYADAPQPHLAGISLRVELYPEQRTAEIRGTYHLVNRSAVPIDTVHVERSDGVETSEIAFDRTARTFVDDGELSHAIYALEQPLAPGDSLQLDFEATLAPRGFARGVAASVVENGTWFTAASVLPALGYQPRRELLKPTDRRKYGLPARPVVPTLADAQDVTGEEHGDGGGGRFWVDAVVGTAEDQTAVAPGQLRRTWTEDGRRYFHYATDGPAIGEFGLFSARYAVHEETRHSVPVQFVYHPGHTANVERLLRSVRASLDTYVQAFGPFPHPNLRLIENPVRRMGAHSDATTIDYGQGFALFDPEQDPRGLDLPFAIMAHEMAHQWGVPIAFAEGAPLLSESFAWYAAMGVVEATYGREHLRRLLRFFRQPHPIPPIRQSRPLLQALDPYAGYRKGPFALFAMSEYMGRDRVDLAWRRFFDAHRAGTPPLPTSLDFYRELQAVTPDSLQTLLHDLFEENTFWDLATEHTSAEPTAAGDWRVTLRIRARKFTVDTEGVETEVPMDEQVQVGVFAPTERGADFGETLYLEWHRIRTGEQTITVTVPHEPSDAGIDPYVLLIDLERFDNVEEVEIES